MSVLAKLFLVVVMLTTATTASAGDETSDRELRRLAELVPPGYHVARLEVRDYMAKRRYDKYGDQVELGADYDQYTLPGGFVTQFDSSLRGQRYRLVFAKGLTDNLTVGAMLPWGTMTQHIDFSATGPGANPTETVQTMLASYGYKRVETTETSGLLDPVLGSRWRVYRGQYDALVIGPGVRVGMTGKDDPDNLADVYWEDGSTDLLLDASYVRLLPASLDVRLQARYANQRPDHVRARAYSTTETLVPQSRTERLRRDLGDMLETSVEMGYRAGYWRYNLTWDAMRKAADDYHSPTGQDVSGLEKDTARSQDAVRVGVTWLGAWAAFHLPLFVELHYREPVKGRNSIASRDYYFMLTSYL